MREIRQSGSAGGEVQINEPSLPLSTNSLWSALVQAACRRTRQKRALAHVSPRWPEQGITFFQKMIISKAVIISIIRGDSGIFRMVSKSADTHLIPAFPWPQQRPLVF